MMLTVFYKHRSVASFDFSYKSFLTYPMLQEYTVQREIDRKRHSEREGGGQGGSERETERQSEREC